ncbi:hypothetical protein HX004_17355 [Myroides sp. 1354]|uniref:RHS repeat domain-containing protein n=1 Tax=unclassified Myroides TaxID=2642485 RepID=UPI0025759BD3|nr:MULTISPECIES: hypothetical protein [unclassified Myroides]MDM1046599.1 hypothetical protein [Myroides sp. R163-1]MDM1057523.1 hypothetical protein [Myroides sp. 1354]MDM1070816.1 hypothetical protein [Myroides sp. 1372]
MWLSVDPLAEKMPSWNPYAYTFNNPINFTDPTGMIGEGIIVGNSIKENFVNNQALNTFASTEEGKAFLSDYAKKGDVVGEHTFNKDGKYHSKGIDIVFESKDLGRDVGGNTSSSIQEGRAEILFTINSNPIVDSSDGNSYDTRNFSNKNDMVKAIIGRTVTIFHETFLHGDHSTKDYLDDYSFNKSNIDPHILNHYKNALKHAGHAQAQFGSDASSLLFNTKGFKGIESANSKWSSGKQYSGNQLKKMMWNFAGSYK